MSERMSRRSAEMAKHWYKDFAANWVSGAGFGYTLGTAIDTPQNPNMWGIGVAVLAGVYSYYKHHDAQTHINHEVHMVNPSEGTRAFIQKQLNKLSVLKVPIFFSGSLTATATQAPSLPWFVSVGAVGVALGIESEERTFRIGRNINIALENPNDDPPSGGSGGLRVRI